MCRQWTPPKSFNLKKMIDMTTLHTDKKLKRSYVSPELVPVGTISSVTRMMVMGPYADATLGLMMM